MRFWLDAHLDPRLAGWVFETFGVIAQSFDEMGFRSTRDAMIFDAARALGDVVIVTKDVDFVKLVERLGAPPQVVWLTIGNTSTPVLKSVLLGSMARILDKLNAGDPFVEIAHA